MPTLIPPTKETRLKTSIVKALQYFNVAEDLEPQAQVEASIREGISFKGSTLLVLIFAIFIASLGLNTNNVAVIIGAMLISPLMGPIMGMGLAIGIEDFSLLRRGLKNICMAILGSVIASAIFFLISPQYEGSSQLLARTSPSIYDVFIALFGGAAGIVSTACHNKGQVMPGVAIATSLMPPLCTAGYGLATLQWHFFFGAFYLFFTNMIFILFATWIGVKVMGFKRVTVEITKGYKRVQAIVYTIVSATIALSAWLTVGMIQKNIFLSKAIAFVDEMNFPNTQVLRHSEYVKDGKRYIDVTLIGDRLPKDSLQVAMTARLDSMGLGGAILNIRQGVAINDRVPQQMQGDKLYEVMQSQLEQKLMLIDSLKEELKMRSAFSDAGPDISPELKVVFPSVSNVALSRVVAVNVADTMRTDTLYMAFVNSPRGLTMSERKRLQHYLEVRLKCSDISLSVNPAGFSWPKSK